MMGSQNMQMTRGIWSFGLLAALVVGGCKKDEPAKPPAPATPATTPVGAPGTTPAAAPSTQGAVSGAAAPGAIALAPGAKPAAELPKAQSSDAPKTAKPADGSAQPQAGFDPATSPQNARAKGWYR